MAGSGTVWIVILNKRFCAVKDLGEPREASRSLRRSNRAFARFLIKLHHYPMPPP
jgi:hypothetical protein